MEMNGQFIEKFRMEKYTLFVLGLFVISFFILYYLIQLLKNLIRTQIDNQMKDIIPIKFVRKRINIKIKWSK